MLQVSPSNGIVLLLCLTLVDIPLNSLFLFLIGLALSPYIPNDFIAIAFDSGGFTTGPITGPFIMALGVG